MSGEGDTANDGDTSAAGDAATGITEDRVVELIKTVGGKAINTAIGERLKDFKSSQTKTLETFKTELVESVTQTLTEGLGAKLEELGVKPNADAAAKGGSLDDDAIKNSPAFKKLQKQLDQQMAESKQLKEQTAAEKKAIRSEKLRNQLLSELTSNGLDPKRANDAADLLILRGRVRHESDESDSIVFRDADGDDVELKTGVADWAKSEDGKLYVPPSGASGSGNPPERRPTVTTSPNGMPSRDAIKASLAKAFTGEIS